MVKQMLVRMPDELHARLRARAAADGRSATSLAVEAIGRQLDSVGSAPKDRLRAALSRRGLLGGVEHVHVPDRALLRRELPTIISNLDDVLTEDRS